MYLEEKKLAKSWYISQLGIFLWKKKRKEKRKEKESELDMIGFKVLNLLEHSHRTYVNIVRDIYYVY